MYKESYDFMMNHPIVKQYKKENKKLKEGNCAFKVYVGTYTRTYEDVSFLQKI